jgi:hypothetical protein
VASITPTVGAELQGLSAIIFSSAAPTPDIPPEAVETLRLELDALRLKRAAQIAPIQGGRRGD